MSYLYLKENIHPLIEEIRKQSGSRRKSEIRMLGSLFGDYASMTCWEDSD